MNLNKTEMDVIHNYSVLQVCESESEYYSNNKNLPNAFLRRCFFYYNLFEKLVFMHQGHR